MIRCSAESLHAKPNGNVTADYSRNLMIYLKVSYWDDEMVLARCSRVTKHLDRVDSLLSRKQQSLLVSAVACAQPEGCQLIWWKPRRKIVFWQSHAT